MLLKFHNMKWYTISNDRDEALVVTYTNYLLPQQLDASEFLNTFSWAFLFKTEDKFTGTLFHTSLNG